jgi:hypothetical protein
MTREEFERLLSDWLDEPLRADLYGLVESACAASPELVELREAWRKSHAITRDTPPALREVDWRAQRDSIRSTIDGEIGAAMAQGKRELEDLVELALPTLGIDWKKQREQIAARLDAHIAQELRPGALDNVLRETDPAEVNWRQERARIAAATTQATRRLRMLRWSGFAAGISAAAAVQAIFLIRPPAVELTPEVPGFSATLVVEAPRPSQPDETAGAASFAVTAPDDLDVAAIDSTEDSDTSSDLYFSMEPALTVAAGS